MAGLIYRVRHSSLLLASVFALAACGGGGSSPSPTPVPDTQPEAFELGDPVTVNTPEAQVESATITVAGINTSAPISVAGGEYRIGSTGAYTTAAGSVALGDLVQVRVTAAATAPSETVATLTIGGVSDTFAVSTEDTTAPVPVVYFPTPNTMTEGDYAVLRGVVEEDFGRITSVSAEVLDSSGNTVNQLDGNGLVTAGEGEDLAEGWTVRVNLATSEAATERNTVRITAQSDAGPAQAVTVEVAIHQSEVAENTDFPEGSAGVIFSNLSSNANGYIVYDAAGSRLIVLEASKLIDINIATGERKFLEGYESENILYGIVSYNNFSELLVSNRDNEVVRFELEPPNSRAAVDAPAPNQMFPRAFLATSDENYVFLSFSKGAARVGEGNIARFNVVTGEQEEISGPTKPEAELNSLAGVHSMLRLSDDEILATNRIYNFDGERESYTGSLIKVNLTTGQQTPLLANPLPNFPFGLDWIESGRRIIFTGQTDLDAAGILYTYDVDAAEPEVFLDGVAGDNKANALHLPRGVNVLEDKQIAFMTISHEESRDFKGSIYVVDLQTKERMVLSRTFIQ